MSSVCFGYHPGLYIVGCTGRDANNHLAIPFGFLDPGLIFL